MGDQGIENEIEFDKKTQLKELFVLKKGPVLVNKCLIILLEKLQENEKPEQYFSNQKDLSLGYVLNFLEIQKSCLFLKTLLEDIDPVKKWKQVN